MARRTRSEGETRSLARGGVGVALLAALLAGCATAPKKATMDPTAAATAAPAATLAETMGLEPFPASSTAGVAAPVQRRATEEVGSGKYHFSEGVRLEAEGQLALAAAAFERAYDADPDLAVAGVNSGILRERLGDADAAGAIYARILDEKPRFAPAARSLVRLRIRSGQLADAEQDVRARLGRDPESPALLVALGDVLLAAGQLDAAEEASRKALKLDERNVAAMVNLAISYHRRKRNELARMVLENARQVDERDPTVWNRLGFVDLALGNRAQALEEFRVAAALGPDYPEARANYGALLADAEDFQAAAAELEVAVRYAPRSALAWLNLGNAFRGTQQFERAEAAYAKAHELDPSLAEVDYNLAVLYLDGEKPGTPALARLEQAVAYFDAYEQKGNADPRIPEYRKDAAKAIEREKKRLQREERDRLRREAEAKKKEDEARKEAAVASAAAAKAAAAAPVATAAATSTSTSTPATATATTTATPTVDPTAAATTTATPTVDLTAAATATSASTPTAAPTPTVDPTPIPTTAPAIEPRLVPTTAAAKGVERSAT